MSRTSPGAEDALAVFSKLSLPEKHRFTDAICVDPDVSEHIVAKAPARWLTFAQAAMLLGVSKSKISRDAKNGLLPARGRSGTRERMVCADAVLQLALRRIGQQQCRKSSPWDDYSDEVGAKWIVPKKSRIRELTNDAFPEKTPAQLRALLESEASLLLEVKRLRARCTPPGEGRWSHKHFVLDELATALQKRIDVSRQKRKARELTARNSLKK